MTAAAPANVTYTIAFSDPDGDPVGWEFAVDGVVLDSGTGGSSPRSYTQAYDAPGNHTAVLTATDGMDTTQRSLDVTLTAQADTAPAA
jgi:hypothetical protein